VILNLFQQSTNAKNLCGSWCARVKKNCEYVLLTQDRYVFHFIFLKAFDILLKLIAGILRVL